MKYLFVILFLTSCTKQVYKPYILEYSKDYTVYDVRDIDFLITPKQDTVPKIGISDAGFPYLINLENLKINEN